MFAGIGILATFITALGSRLIEFKLKDRSTKEKKIELIRNELSTKTKELIKDQIERVETLDDRDFDALIAMLTKIRQNYGIK
jgi:hypothetical protein